MTLFLVFVDKERSIKSITCIIKLEIFSNSFYEYFIILEIEKMSIYCQLFHECYFELTPQF